MKNLADDRYGKKWKKYRCNDYFKKFDSQICEKKCKNWILIFIESANKKHLIFSIISVWKIIQLWKHDAFFRQKLSYIEEIEKE